MLKYQIIIGLLCFALGVTAVIAIQNYRNTKGYDIYSENKLFNSEGSIDSRALDSFFDDDFFRSSKSPFEEMEKMRERMMKQIESFENNSKGETFDSWFKGKFGGGNPGEIRQREDDVFVYYDVIIKDLVNQKLNIRVEGGQIAVSGTIEKRSSDKDDEGSSRQHFSSTFHRSFPVPYGVDETKAQMEQDGEKIVIKLPKN